MKGLHTRRGQLRRRTAARPGCEEWEVELDGGELAPAVVLPELQTDLQPGDGVLLNVTAVELGLGTGGAHFVLGRLDPDTRGGPGPFAGREAGHILKLRYTPLQFRVLAAEEEASPHHAAVRDFRGLRGMPVLAAELHSQAGAAAIAARATAPGIRIVLLQLDSAALPFGLSRLGARLRSERVLDAVVTSGQGFGGDFEAVNVHSGLVVAACAAHADLVIVTQGPGNVGTGTEYGFSGLSLAEALHAAAILGGRGLLAPRLSDGDTRSRHCGVSHHTATLLRCTLSPVVVPLPTGFEWTADDSKHAAREFPQVDPAPAAAALEPYRTALTTMGRTLDRDPLFFAAAAAAGIFAARMAGDRSASTTAESGS